MKREELSDAMNMIEDELLIAASAARENKRAKKSRFSKAAVAAAVIAVIVMTLTAAGVVTNYQIIRLYFGSIINGTAVNGNDGAKIVAVPVSDDTIKFVIEADTEVAPFDEYTELLITNFCIWDGDKPIGGVASDMLHSTPDWFDIYSANCGWGDDKSDVKFDLITIDRDLHLKYERRLPQDHTYTFVVYALTGRNADGDLIEIQGEWIIDFTI